MSEQPLIFMSESLGFSPVALTALRQFAELRMGDATREELLAGVKDAEVLWIRLRHQIDRELFTAAAKLKMIVTPTTGLNHIDLAAAQEHGVRVLSLQGETDFLKDIRATAELTVGLMLALLRQLPAATRYAREGGWNRDLFQGRELCGKTVGIIGFGRLGKLVARYLAAFDCRLLAVDPHRSPSAMPANVELLPLEQVLQQAEIVTLHVNLCEATAGFFGRREFRQMRPGAWFINTARGELIDEVALATSLREGRLAGAALDVLSHESSAGMGGHSLVALARQQENLLLTPHLGGCTAESMAKTEAFMAEKFIQAWSTLLTSR